MKKRNVKFIIGGVIIAVALGYLVYAQIYRTALYYLTVSELKEKGLSETSGEMVRVGGTVLDGSVQYNSEEGNLHFTVTDGESKLPVVYKGTAPNNFGPGVELVLEGRYASEEMFEADKIMPKCRSKYEAQAD